MCDFFDDFEDDFDNDFMDEDEYDADTEKDDPVNGDSDLDGEPDDAESKADDLGINPFIIGGAMGFAYEEGLNERKRRKRKRFSDDSD